MPLLNIPADWADWKKAALEITGHFEDSANPFGAVSGDFDQMGISLGVLQWNIGSGSLQPLVRAIGQSGVISKMPAYGGELWSACTSPISSGLQTVRSWQNGSHLRKDVLAELKVFTSSDLFVAQQIEAAEDTAQRAFKDASQWASASNSQTDKPLFCWFFDLHTQNGGLKTVTYASVQAFISQTGAESVDDIVCDWLASKTPADAGYRDAWKNADLWRDKVPTGRLNLFAAAYLRSGLSKAAWRADVLNRKATIALGSGYVHLEFHNLKTLLGL